MVGTRNARRRTRVCFVAPAIYPALDPLAGIQHIGGMEVQQKLLGEGLHSLGYEIHYITRDFGQPDGIRKGCGIVHRTHNGRDGIPGLRFFYPALPALWHAFRRADADILYVRGSGYLIALAALFARRHGRRSVFATAHDWDVDPSLRRLPTRRDEYLYRYGLGRADAVVVQSLHQQQLLERHHGRRGHLIHSACPEPDAFLQRGDRRKTVLWVAMFRREKQPLDVVRLARVFPQYRFVMVGGPAAGQEALFHQVQAEARDLPNLNVEGFRAQSQVAQYYSDATVLLNTSCHEGFPNTFLQAWSHGLPVLSYVDPDGVIGRHGLGVHATSFEGLCTALPDLVAAAPALAEMVRAYFRANHSLDNALAAYDRLFTELVCPEGRLACSETDDKPADVNGPKESHSMVAASSRTTGQSIRARLL